MDYNYCQSCGRFSMNEGRYCTFCGKEFCEKLLVPCTSCGRNIAVESVFCTWCGKKCTPVKKEYFTFYKLEAEKISKLSKNKFICNKSSGVIRDIIPVPDDFIIEKTEEGYVLQEYTGKGGDVVVPKGVTVIGKQAFCECTSLTSVDLPDSVTSIGDYAFPGCKSLTSVVLPNNLTSIGETAFYVCRSLTSITIPKNVKEIGENAFGFDLGEKDNTKISDFKIRCYEGTADEKYAVENGFKYELIG